MSCASTICSLTLIMTTGRSREECEREVVYLVSTGPGTTLCHPMIE